VSGSAPHFLTAKMNSEGLAPEAQVGLRSFNSGQNLRPRFDGLIGHNRQVKTSRQVRRRPRGMIATRKNDLSGGKGVMETEGTHRFEEIFPGIVSSRTSRTTIPISASFICKVNERFGANLVSKL
jgi:hypothetical protein